MWVGGSSHGLDQQQLWRGDGESWILAGLGADLAVGAPGGRPVANAVGGRGGQGDWARDRAPAPSLPPPLPSFLPSLLYSVSVYWASCTFQKVLGQGLGASEMEKPSCSYQ